MLAKPIIILNSVPLKILNLSDIAKIFSEYIENNDLLLLSGKVGSGKTEFSRLLIKAKAEKENVDIEEISSPTFSLIQSYDFKFCKISHIDLYRINSEEELFELGIPDIFDSQITILEWPEIIETKNLSRFVTIEIQENNELKDYREVKIAFFGYGWNDLIGALVSSMYFKHEKI